MTDKASGELGKAIAHPLQAKVDRILALNLGDKKDWKVGSIIHFSRFNHIRNKSYVRQRLEALGFTPNLTDTDYRFTGVSGYSSKASTNKQKSSRIKSKLELASVALKQSDLKIAIVEGLLTSGKPVNSSAITADGKLKLKMIIANLKKRKGASIESVFIKEGGESFTIYAPDDVYSELAGNMVRSSLKDVTAYLDKYGEISAAKTGLPAKKLNSHIRSLRVKGYEIETIGVGRKKEAVFKLISRP
jgi:hypothetical protein